MSKAIFCEIQHGRCEQRDLADFAAMTSRENPLYSMMSVMKIQNPYKSSQIDFII